MIEATILDPEEQVAFQPPEFAQVVQTIEALATTFEQGLRAVAPDKVSVELSVGMAVESGKLLAFLAKANASANLKVTIEWKSKTNPS